MLLPWAVTDRLVRLLQCAYSGELAAALAYRGHARSVRRDDERESIESIERDEWEHRREVGEMLDALGAAPGRIRERRAALVGTALGLLCRVVGWFAPMYAAGRLERRNIEEYVDGAALATACGHGGFAAELLAMAAREWEHERFFREKAASHALWRFVPKWAPAGRKPEQSAVRIS